MAKKILLAEDSATMRKVVELVFASANYQVMSVDTVEQAVAAVKREIPDIFIADLSMQGKNGYDACEAVKGIAPVPVLLLHGERARFDAARARRVGADGDLRKPFATQVIIDKVEELLRKKSSSARLGVKPLSAPIETGEVVLEAGAAEESADKSADKSGRGATAAPSVGRAAGGAPPRAPVSGAPRPASPAMPPQVGGAARGQAAAGLKRSRTMPASGVPPLPQPPPGMPRLGAAPAAPKAAKIPQPTDIPMPSGPADDNLDVEIMIEADPPPEVEVDVAPALHQGPPTVAAGTIDSGVRMEPPKSPPRRRVPSQPVARSKTEKAKTEKAAPDVASGASGGLERKVVEATEQVVKAAEEALPAALRGVDPAVVVAISELTREVLERVVWEVVPDLAEAIIKEELERLIAAREK